MITDLSNATDAVADSLDALPRCRSAARSRWRDYYELTKPRMNFLVVITTMVGCYMAGRSLSLSHGLLLLDTLLGTAMTAAAASVFNQYAERRYDALMRRTEDRPLPAQRLAPRDALAFGLALAVAGVTYLALLVNPLTAGIGAFTLLSYVFIYTPMKRRSSLNTIIGAVPGALPVVMGMTAFQNALSPESVALFMIMFVWQMPHFLAIAILYRDDYAAAGFKMLPVVDPGLHMTVRQILIYSLALIPVSLLPAMLGMAGLGYAIAALGLGLAFLSVATTCAINKTRADARKLFLASIIYLPLLFTALMIGRIA